MELVMAVTNAERQRLWRERQAARLKVIHNDWHLFVKAATPVLRDLRAEGKKEAATISPSTVAHRAALLERMIERWHDLPLETKKRLAAAKRNGATKPWDVGM
jgi:hypothetical protein